MNHKAFEHNQARAFRRARSGARRRRKNMSRHGASSMLHTTSSDPRPLSATEERFVLTGWDEV